MNSCHKRLIEPCGHRSGDYEVHETSIGPGNQGTAETLTLMARLVKESLTYQDFCTFVANLVCNQFSALHPDAVDRYLRSIYRYEFEDVETLLSPAFNAWWFSRTGFLRGDCDDISMFFSAVMIALGYKTRFVAMRTKRGDPEFYHVVSEVQYDGGLWKRFDLTVAPGTVHADYGVMIQYV